MAKEWIKRVKSEGAVPLLELDDCSDGWSTPPPNTFMVRSPHYFSTKLKVPESDYLLKPLGFDWIKAPTKISHLLTNPKHRIWTAFQNPIATPKPFIWAFNLQLPSRDYYYGIVSYFVSLDPIPQGSLMDQFLKGDDTFRNKRLKLIVNIVKGPWIVKKAVGGEQAICIIGRSLTCNYSITDNFIQVDIDVESSVLAKAAFHVAFEYFTSLTVDIAFAIESQTQSELPERILGGLRFSELKADSAGLVEMPCDDTKKGDQLKPSFSSRLWKHFVQTDTTSSKW